VRSSTRAVGPLVWTEAIPLFLTLVPEYISLRPMGSPLRATDGAGSTSRSSMMV
jgi:hypothetical protein